MEDELGQISDIGDIRDVLTEYDGEFTINSGEHSGKQTIDGCELLKDVLRHYSDFVLLTYVTSDDILSGNIAKPEAFGGDLIGDLKTKPTNGTIKTTHKRYVIELFAAILRARFHQKELTATVLGNGAESDIKHHERRHRHYMDSITGESVMSEETLRLNTDSINIHHIHGLNE